MGQASGQIISFAVGVALSPIPIIAVVLMLATPRAGVNGPAFVLGWVLGLVVVGTIVLVGAGGAGASEHGAPATWISVVKIALAILLALVALREWRGRPRGEAEPVLPAWMRTIDSFEARRALGMGAALSAVNPKNLLLTVAAAAAIAQTGASTAGQAGAMAVFLVIAMLGPAIPVGVYLLMGERAPALLESVRAWMVRENATIMAVICLILSAKLIGDALSGLSA
jgi:threonine/homoserine/homoserine lactone efflux protein